MRPPYITDQFLNQFVQASLAEDVGDGDHTTRAVIEDKKRTSARLLIKEPGVLAGVDLAVEIFCRYDPSLSVNVLRGDGSTVVPGDVAFTVDGTARSILTTERLVLNCMQRMSAIATLTNKLVKLIAGTDSSVLDTRKTSPGFRAMEKWAVVIGGGKNHRMGLYDMVMLKDNHIDMAGGVKEAINRAKAYLRASKLDLKIEIEVRNLSEVKQVLECDGVDVVMLDNMSLPEMSEAVRLINGRCRTEASGSITEQTIREVANCGVDFISVGAITHSAKSLDMSLKVIS
ncbi:carboxylating nicotinate-nucleotide diphosphorylase [Oscillatoria amoena NRMC-F 0135]|nr:carboxylating nicotinate-nucleotide diphosphorylase [Oscillatoria amoena NRMC-F 0135]